MFVKILTKIPAHQAPQPKGGSKASGFHFSFSAPTLPPPPLTKRATK